MLPIAIFAFNRPDLLQRTLTALLANELAGTAALTIFCDGPRHEQDEPATRAVRTLAKSVQGVADVEVVERPHNMGCAASIIDGLTEMFRLHERLIVIEDDIVTSPYTLRFLSEGLARYADNERVFNIAAWTPPHIARKIAPSYPCDVYAIPRFNCWGWASWRDRFQDIDWTVKDYQTFKNSPQLRKAFNAGGNDLSPMLDMQMEGKINAWDIRADYARFKRNMLGINPVHSYVFNTGIGSGTHTTAATTYWDSNLAKAVEYPRFLDEVTIDPQIHEIYRSCFNQPKLSFSERLKNKIKKIKYTLETRRV
ncbi:glycosyltransferase [Desulfovibrio piger]|uniref:glycosyltransferase n=1 Tax=Desulfovibrio piger TaxID=901 RepID=UPI0026ED5384|nr:glycosyltransferase [Desulfovibrio piger]